MKVNIRPKKIIYGSCYHLQPDQDGACLNVKWGVNQVIAQFDQQQNLEIKPEMQKKNQTNNTNLHEKLKRARKFRSHGRELYRLAWRNTFSAMCTLRARTPQTTRLPIIIRDVCSKKHACRECRGAELRLNQPRHALKQSGLSGREHRTHTHTHIHARTMTSHRHDHTEK